MFRVSFPRLEPIAYPAVIPVRGESLKGRTDRGGGCRCGEGAGFRLTHGGGAGSGAAELPANYDNH